jgi:hypothetical protein
VVFQLAAFGEERGEAFDDIRDGLHLTKLRA